MAKRQGGRVRGGGRRPVKRGAGMGRVLVGFVAGLLVAVAVLAWLQWKTEWPARWILGSLGMPRRLVQQPDGSSSGGLPQARAPRETAAEATPPVKNMPRASEENGAAGVPGVPVASGAGQPPFGESEEVFEAGARVYGAQCASCHGRPGRVAAGEKSEDAAGQFWTKDGGAAVARQPVGVIFQEITVGRPERQMPAYRRVLSDSERWDLALLLKNAGGAELPDPVVRILRAGR